LLLLLIRLVWFGLRLRSLVWFDGWLHLRLRFTLLITVYGCIYVTLLHTYVGYVYTFGLFYVTLPRLPVYTRLRLVVGWLRLVGYILRLVTFGLVYFGYVWLVRSFYVGYHGCGYVYTFTHLVGWLRCTVTRFGLYVWLRLGYGCYTHYGLLRCLRCGYVRLRCVYVAFGLVVVTFTFVCLVWLRVHVVTHTFTVTVYVTRSHTHTVDTLHGWLLVGYYVYVWLVSFGYGSHVYTVAVVYARLVYVRLHVAVGWLVGWLRLRLVTFTRLGWFAVVTFTFAFVVGCWLRLVWLHGSGYRLVVTHVYTFGLHTFTFTRIYVYVYTVVTVTVTFWLRLRLHAFCGYGCGLRLVTHVAPRFTLGYTFTVGSVAVVGWLVTLTVTLVGCVHHGYVWLRLLLLPVTVVVTFIYVYVAFTRSHHTLLVTFTLRLRFGYTFVHVTVVTFTYHTLVRWFGYLLFTTRLRLRLRCGWVYTRLRYTFGYVYICWFTLVGWLRLPRLVTFTFGYFGWLVTFAFTRLFTVGWLRLFGWLRLRFVLHGCVYVLVTFILFGLRWLRLRVTHYIHFGCLFVTFTRCGYVYVGLRLVHGCGLRFVWLVYTLILRYRLRLRLRLVYGLRLRLRLVTHGWLLVSWLLFGWLRLLFSWLLLVWLVGYSCCCCYSCWLRLFTFTLRVGLRLVTFTLVYVHTRLLRLRLVVGLRLFTLRLVTVYGYIYVWLRFGCLRLRYTVVTLVYGWLRYTVYVYTLPRFTFTLRLRLRLRLVGLVTFTVTFTVVYGYVGLRCWLVTFVGLRLPHWFTHVYTVTVAVVTHILVYGWLVVYTHTFWLVGLVYVYTRLRLRCYVYIYTRYGLVGWFVYICYVCYGCCFIWLVYTVTLLPFTRLVTGCCYVCWLVGYVYVWLRLRLFCVYVWLRLFTLLGYLGWLVYVYVYVCVYVYVTVGLHYVVTFGCCYVWLRLRLVVGCGWLRLRCLVYGWFMVGLRWLVTFAGLRLRLRSRLRLHTFTFYTRLRSRLVGWLLRWLLFTVVVRSHTVGCWLHVYVTHTFTVYVGLRLVTVTFGCYTRCVTFAVGWLVYVYVCCGWLRLVRLVGCCCWLPLVGYTGLRYVVGYGCYTHVGCWLFCVYVWLVVCLRSFTVVTFGWLRLRCGCYGYRCYVTLLRLRCVCCYVYVAVDVWLFTFCVWLRCYTFTLVTLLVAPHVPVVVGCWFGCVCLVYGYLRLHTFTRYVWLLVGWLVGWLRCCYGYVYVWLVVYVTLLRYVYVVCLYTVAFTLVYAVGCYILRLLLHTVAVTFTLRLVYGWLRVYVYVRLPVVVGWLRYGLRSVGWLRSGCCTFGCLVGCIWLVGFGCYVTLVGLRWLPLPFTVYTRYTFWLRLHTRTFCCTLHTHILYTLRLRLVGWLVTLHTFVDFVGYGWLGWFVTLFTFGSVWLRTLHVGWLGWFGYVYAVTFGWLRFTFAHTVYVYVTRFGLVTFTRVWLPGYVVVGWVTVTVVVRLRLRLGWLYVTHVYTVTVGWLLALRLVWVTHTFGYVYVGWVTLRLRLVYVYGWLRWTFAFGYVVWLVTFTVGCLRYRLVTFTFTLRLRLVYVCVWLVTFGCVYIYTVVHVTHLVTRLRYGCPVWLRYILRFGCCVRLRLLVTFPVTHGCWLHGWLVTVVGYILPVTFVDLLVYVYVAVTFTLLGYVYIYVYTVYTHTRLRWLVTFGYGWLLLVGWLVLVGYVYITHGYVGYRCYVWLHTTFVYTFTFTVVYVYVYTVTVVHGYTLPLVAVGYVVGWFTLLRLRCTFTLRLVVVRFTVAFTVV